MLVFEAGEDGWEEGRGPDSVVVGKDDDVCCGVLDAVGHLEAFVGEWYGQYADALWVDSVGEVLERTKHFFFCDDEDFLGFASEPGAGSVLEFFAGVDCRDNDGDIFRGDIGGVLGEWDRAVD